MSDDLEVKADLEYDLPVSIKIDIVEVTGEGDGRRRLEEFNAYEISVSVE